MKHFFLTVLAACSTGLMAMANACPDCNSMARSVLSARDASAAAKVFYEAESQFYDIESPCYDEEKFIPVLKAMNECKVANRSDKQRASFILEMASKNRKDSVAADIAFTKPDGSCGSLHQIEADYVILFFNNPDCDECSVMKHEMESDQRLQSLIGEGRVVILGIYPFDDEPLWLTTPYPDFMVNGMDKDCTIEETCSYDIRRIPSLYLLDKEKRVMLKNAPLAKILNIIK